MKLLVENHGLSWIAVQVFGYLDNKSLTTARLVKSSWRNLIDEKLLELRKQQQEKIRAKIEELKSQFRQSFNFEKWPEWNGIFKDFKNNRNLQTKMNVPEGLGGREPPPTAARGRGPPCVNFLLLLLLLLLLLCFLL